MMLSLQRFERSIPLLVLLLTNAVMGVESERTVQAIHFAKGKSEVRVSGKLKGGQFIDYQLRVGAGQTISVSLKGSHRSNYFNILPPGSPDAAMVIGEMGDNAFTGMLPDDGLYTIRVFLMRSAARRNETSQFDLQVAIKGKPLAALSAKADAVVAGTRFHAIATVPCQPAYTALHECQAGVVRRSQDGSATVELSWQIQGQAAGKRRILFVNGEPVASDTPQAIHYQRNERGWLIEFEAPESYTIPEALVRGG